VKNSHSIVIGVGDSNIAYAGQQIYVACLFAGKGIKLRLHK